MMRRALVYVFAKSHISPIIQKLLLIVELSGMHVAEVYLLVIPRLI
jgi:hypothetical protein